MDIKTLERIKALRHEAGNFEGFHDRYEQKYASDGSCDKKGYGFCRDDRFAAFKATVTFDSWAGYYGNSSCSRILSVSNDEIVRAAFVKALDVNQRIIFETMAKLMREEAASLTGNAQSELDALQQMLSSIVDLPQAAE